MAHTILVADDEPDTLDLLEITLGRAGYRVLKARNGKEAACQDDDQRGVVQARMIAPALVQVHERPDEGQQHDHAQREESGHALDVVGVVLFRSSQFDLLHTTMWFEIDCTPAGNEAKA